LKSSSDFFREVTAILLTIHRDQNFSFAPRGTEAIARGDICGELRCGAKICDRARWLPERICAIA